MHLFNAETIIYLASNLFRIYVIVRFLNVFFSKTTANKRIGLITVSLYFGVNSLLYLAYTSPYLNLLSNIVLLFLLTYIYRAKIMMRALSTIMIFAINLFCEDILYRLLLAVHSSNTAASGTVASSLLMFFIVLLFENLIDLRGHYNVSAINWALTFIIPLISVFTSVIILNGASDNLLAAAGAVGLLLINVCVFYLFDAVIRSCREKYENALLKQQNDAYLNQFSMIQQANDNIRMLRHDMQNHLIAMQGIASKGDPAHILDYLQSMQESIQVPDQYLNTGNAVVDSILNLKISEAKKDGAEVELDINIPAETGISQFEMNIILGNLLDNAIRGICECSEKKIWIEMTYDRNTLYIAIKNTYKEKVHVNHGEFLTSREDADGHGLGLRSVERAAAKYNGVVHVEYDDTTFLVDMILYLF